MSSLTDITTYIAQHATPDKLLLAAGLIASFYVIFIHQKHKDLAPGPWALPYFGNAFQVPTEKSWVYFYNICKKFGEFVSLNDLHRTVIDRVALRQAPWYDLTLQEARCLSLTKLKTSMNW